LGSAAISLSLTGGGGVAATAAILISLAPPSHGSALAATPFCRPSFLLACLVFLGQVVE